MKQSDIFSIIIIATVGTMAAYFGLNAWLGDPNLLSVNVKTIDPISANLEEPDSELFNPDVINPTVEVYVGECKDVDQNGILSVDELISCGLLTKEEAEEQETFYCPDGTKVLNIESCSEKQEVQTQAVVLCPDGTTAAKLDECSSQEETPEEQ